MEKQRHLVWFRNDLRVEDNRALKAAAAESVKDDGEIVAVFTPPYEQWRHYGHGSNKLHFWYACAEKLKTQLEKLNIPVLVIDTKRYRDIPDALLKRAQRAGITHLYFNDEYAVDERTRDVQVKKAFRDASIAVTRYTDMIQFTPGELRTGKGDFYGVFTPFSKKWHQSLGSEQLSPSSPPSKQSAPKGMVSDMLKAPGVSPHIDMGKWPAGEDAAQERLAQFIQKRVARYSENRDFPHLTGTSELSAYLAVGAISSRQCLNAMMHQNHGHLADGDKGTSTWVNEIIWREFYQHLMVGYPRVCKHQPFREEGKDIAWRNDENELKAWKEGQTGYPLIDAAMQQLVTTGWMHNRLRMVVAMFLSKHLLIDWRWGESFFLEHLVDGELGANNGGWQWASSTGTDASPYFRLFNPTTQSQRFDPQGEFIATWLKGFDQLEPKNRHAPTPEQRKKLGYPPPIVDHKAARERALKVFADAFKRDS